MVTDTTIRTLKKSGFLISIDEAQAVELKGILSDFCPMGWASSPQEWHVQHAKLTNYCWHIRLLTSRTQLSVIQYSRTESGWKEDGSLGSYSDVWFALTGGSAC